MALSPTEYKQPHVVEFARTGALRYMERAGLAVPTIDFGRVVSCPVRGHAIARTYMMAPAYDERALPAYRAFRDEAVRQFAFLTRPAKHGGMGVAVEVAVDDPYPDAAAMTQDLERCHRLKVYATGGAAGGHPFFTNDENDIFRAVHDVFGHASIGRGFDRHGEEAAWLKHSAMFSPLAQRALTTETRGQNCAFIYHFGGKHFPEQKVTLLPAVFCAPRNVTFAGGRGEPA